MATSSTALARVGAHRIERNTKFIFLVPTILYLMLLGIFPLIFSLFLVFSKWRAGDLSWVGLENIDRLFQQDRYWNSLKLTLLYVLIVSALELFLGTVVALALQSAIRTKSALRLAFTVPMLLPPISVSYAWKMLFDYNRGPLNYFLEELGLDRVEWVGNGTTAFISIMIVDVWQWTPFVALGVLAALEALPSDIFEAATIDGAGIGALLRDLTLPLLAPYAVALIALRSIDAFKVIDSIIVLTGGGPGTATEVLTYYGYVDGYRPFNLGRMAAVAWTLVIVMTIVFMVFLRFFRRDEEVE